MFQVYKKINFEKLYYDKKKDFEKLYLSFKINICHLKD